MKILEASPGKDGKGEKRERWSVLLICGKQTVSWCLGSLQRWSVLLGVYSEPSDLIKTQMYMFSRANGNIVCIGKKHVPKIFSRFLKWLPLPLNGFTSYRIPWNRWFSVGGDFAPFPSPGTFGNVGRHFWLSYWRDATAVQWAEARNEAKYLTLCPQYLGQNTRVAAVENPCFLNKELP